MIKFGMLRFKNINSVGDNWIEIDMSATSRTLIIGHNGAGKSTMLDALSYVLFGKPHREVKLGQLVNTINNKGLLVEIEFTIGPNEYKIVRGMKPNKFEIWKNGEMFDKESHSRLQQARLEKDILMMNHKSFHQVVVLGSTNFIPFMKLKTLARREVIEDLLDINIFSKMNIVMKAKQKHIKSRLSEAVHNISLKQVEIDAKRQLIDELTTSHDDEVALKNASIDELATAMSDIETVLKTAPMDKYKEMNEQIQSKLSEIEDEVSDITREKYQVSHKVKDDKKAVEFFNNHDDCPTCNQLIDPAMKKDKLSQAMQSIETCAEVLEASDSKINELNTKKRAVKEAEDKLKERVQGLKDEKARMENMQWKIDNFKKEIGRLMAKVGNLNDERDELDTLNTQLASMQQTNMAMKDSETYNTAVLEMLKDSGIKSKIIKQYVPVINKVVNEYLEILDFFVLFNLDEEFNETIKSRHRDTFSYSSFSEGEKQRIDLALLFTWREIARMKNSISTNLLIMDETFDKSLDDDGIDNLFRILYSLDKSSNVFVISHKGEMLEGKFERTFKYSKPKNFTEMAIV